MASHCKCNKCFNSLMSTESVCYDCGGRVTPPGCEISMASKEPEFICLSTSGKLIPSTTSEKDLLSTHDTELPVFANYSEENPPYCNSDASTIIEKLKMEKFYPKKLKWDDVVQIRKQQTSLCFSLIEKIMMLDYRTNNFLQLYQNKILAKNTDCDNPHESVISEPCESSQTTILNPLDELENAISFSLDDRERLTSDDHAMQIQNKLHYMDVMNVIYNCCDNILLQTLVEKLYLCRLGIPLIFPVMNENKFNFLLWSLRGIVPQYKNVTSPEQSLVDIPQRFFAFVRIGRLSISKSKLLNEILSDTSHNTFFHRDCEEEMLPRIKSNGTVEASWYLPSASDGKSFDTMFTVLNLRGDFRYHPKLANWISRIGQSVFVLIDLNSLGSQCLEEFFAYFERFKTSIVVCIIADIMESVKKCTEGLKLLLSCLKSIRGQVYKILMNWSEGRLISFGEFKFKLQDVIRLLSEENNQKFSISDIANNFPESCFFLDQNDPVCNRSYSFAKQVTEPIAICSPELRKVNVLRLQGEMWKKWTRLRKEQYRTKMPDELLDDFTAKKEAEQKICRKEQFKLIQDRSNFAMDICKYLEDVSQSDESLYFISWMQLIFNIWSRESLPTALNNYCLKLEETRKKWNNALDESEKNLYIKELDELRAKLENTSFGLEHIFREFSQMYEASECVCEQPLHPCTIMPVVIARLILRGLPFEIMDGDTAFIPVTWVKAVFTKIKEIVGDKKLFVISVIGMQSSGKSTMLNAIFGLKFAVSAGRCTKGLFCQLIPIDRENMNIDCDYILIVDTEGLRAPELQGVTQVHDNELATFVIGLADITIVNIKGENNAEMNDILQIVIHAMIRIKLVKPTLLKPSCFFVHQNVSAIDAGSKLNIEKQTFLSKLDKITADAALEERNSGVQHFQDIISYDEQEYAFYMPDLWLGHPPMYVVNPSYSEKIEEIKQKLIKIVIHSSKPNNITSFTTKISDLWDAILGENFVFSFKNNEEVRVYSRLDETFTNICDDFKDFSLECQSFCQNVIQPIREVHVLMEEKRNLLDKIMNELPEKCHFLQEQLDHYFDSNNHKDILEQWRGRYRANLDNLCKFEQSMLKRMVEENVEMKCKKLETTDKADLYCRERITETAMETAIKLRTLSMALNNEQLGKYFSKEWPKWLQMFSSSDAETDSSEIILKSLSDQLFDCFSFHTPLLKEEFKKNPLKMLQNHAFEDFVLHIDDKDLVYLSFKHWKAVNLITHFKRKVRILATQQCNTVFNSIKTYMKSCTGSDFLPGQASHVIKILRTFFSLSEANCRQFEFNYKHEFQIRFTIEICKCSANEFIRNKNNYLENNHPLAEIRSKKDHFLDLFIKAYKNIATEHTAADWLSNEISDCIEKTVSADLGRLIKLAVLKNETSCFKTKEKFLNRILFEIGESRDFNQYISYRSNEGNYLEKKVRDYVLLEMNEKDGNKTKLEKIIEFEVITKLKSLLKSFENKLVGMRYKNVEEFLLKLTQAFRDRKPDKKYPMTFFRRFTKSGLDKESIGMPTFPVDRLGFLRTFEIRDFEWFTKILFNDVKSLSSRICHSIGTRTKNDGLKYEPTQLFSYLRFAKGTNPVDLLLEKVFGCTERCPFCNIPCKYTCVNHAGDHCVSQHCAKGVNGYSNAETGMLVITNCESSVASESRFKNDKTSGSYVPYTKYREFYPNWEITPNREVESSLYWKWFVVTFHNDLVKHFDMAPACLPAEWKKISWEKAADSLKY